MTAWGPPKPAAHTGELPTTGAMEENFCCSVAPGGQPCGTSPNGGGVGVGEGVGDGIGMAVEVAATVVAFLTAGGGIEAQAARSERLMINMTDRVKA
jgi:hypothetical protein